jgi:Domain of Unknown Function (DUF1206)
VALTGLSRLTRAVRSAHRSTSADRLARAGLLARGVFYVVLAFLVGRIAVLGGQGGKQADTNGALQLVSQTVAGKVAVGAAGVGLVGFGAMRLTAGWLDLDADRSDRVITMLQGLLYLGLAYIPASFLFGDHSTGTEHQQHSNAARLLGFPGGQELVVIAGLVVIGMLGWQIRTAVTGDYEDTMQLADASLVMKRVVHVVGRLGIVARALVFMPVGAFLVVAGIQYDPDHADGLDGELLALSHHAWGLAVISVAALGLVVFAAYTFLEARYRDVTAGG